MDTAPHSEGQAQSKHISAEETGKKSGGYLEDGGGVWRGEDRGVVVDIGDVNVEDDGGGHGGRAAVEGLH